MPISEAAQARMSTIQLDNPIWSALTTDQAKFAVGGTLARRYQEEIGPLSGIAEPSAEAWEELRSVAGPGGIVAQFFLKEPQIPAGWTVFRRMWLYQMIAQQPRLAEGEPPAGAELRALTAEDAPAMVELAELTEPGPFRLRTIELGDYFGIFHGNRLMAMAGKRMQMPRAAEVSAVCTHPEARGRGYARLLMSRVMERMIASGKTPFLHTLQDNAGAIRLYESLGFMQRQSPVVVAMKRDD